MNRVILVSCLAATTMLACGDDPKPEPNTSYDAAGAAQQAPPPAPAEGDEDKQANVGISDEIRNLCDLPDARFDFDSARLSSQAKDVLSKLVTCFNDGPAKGKGLNVVGHADPRGPESYNFGLGQRRAGAVEQYLVQNGLGDDRIESSSRGEMDATGTDAEGWARDRRVDIEMAE